MNTVKSDGFDAIDLLQLIWSRKGLILVGGLVAALGFGGLSLFMPTTYRAEVLVAPRKSAMPGSSIKGLLPELSGIVGLPSLGSTGPSELAVALATLQSRIVVGNVIRKMEVGPRLSERISVLDFGSRFNHTSEYDQYNRFKEYLLSVEDAQEPGLVIIAVEWVSAEEAARWATALVDETNNHLREQAIGEAKRNLEFLHNQLQNVNQLELQRALFSLIESELKKVMLAEGQKDFALTTIDPAFVPTQPHGPRRGLGTAMGFAAGVVSVLILILLTSALRAGQGESPRQ